MSWRPLPPRWRLQVSRSADSTRRLPRGRRRGRGRAALRVRRARSGPGGARAGRSGGAPAESAGAAPARRARGTPGIESARPVHKRRGCSGPPTLLSSPRDGGAPEGWNAAGTKDVRARATRACRALHRPRALGTHAPGHLPSRLPLSAGTASSAVGEAGLDSARDRQPRRRPRRGEGQQRASRTSRSTSPARASRQVGGKEQVREERVAHAQVRGHGAAEEAGEPDAPSTVGARHDVEQHADEHEHAQGQDGAGG